MPLADHTAIANLALDHLGEPYLTDYATDTGTTAEAVRLHLPQCVETVLEGHTWSFAKRTAQPDLDGGLVISGTLTDGTSSVSFPTLHDAGVNMLPGDINNPDSAKYPVRVFSEDGTVDEYPPATGTKYIFLALFVENLFGSTGTLCALAKFVDGTSTATWSAFSETTSLPSDISVVADYTWEPASPATGTPALSFSTPRTPFAPWGSLFNLPSDCLRVIQINGDDIDVPQNRFEIQGRNLLLEEEDAALPVITYITNAPPVDEWPTTFTDAVAFLLASRLAPKLTGSMTTADAMLAKHELALGRARSKDARETRSRENHGPRQLAARSGLVNARYNTTARPPY